MTEQSDLFTIGSRTAADARLQAFVAPVSAKPEAVMADPLKIALARRLEIAFGESATGSLTRSDLFEACRDLSGRALFDANFDDFVRDGLLELTDRKRHGERYSLNPASSTGLMVFERVMDTGGVTELAMLLESTQRQLESKLISRDQLQQALVTSRYKFINLATHLRRMLRIGDLAELVDEQRYYADSDRLTTAAANLIDLVFKRHRRWNLAGDANRVIEAAQDYDLALDAYMQRVLDHVSVRRRVGLVAPEAYRSLTSARIDALAQVFAGIIFDPPQIVILPEDLEAVLFLDKARPPGRTRPELPVPAGHLINPVEAAQQQRQASRDHRIRLAEIYLRGDDERDITPQLRAAGWPRTGRDLAELIALSKDPAAGFEVVLGDGVSIQATAAVAYLSHVVLRRHRAQRTAGLHTSTRTDHGR